ncbi:hypothetical protein [Kribbella speibonae]|uniref:Uncharacterized protein n=1 Tax=Kribbella speibonae TaxID=1572660 RepID=A0A4R0JHS1_9ACTN|nr:hypothetical protein [Kribbella speibonae]TCC20037.1 hypothetical protein E0H58_28265 [Kribbella speibonae]TCC41305.1 hypothetical protein E0H92_06465 [Kribbella speibonae]
MAQSRGKLIDELTDDITRSALASANLTAEDRVLAGERVRQAIAAEAMGAHRDVVAVTVDKNSPAAEPFGDYLHSSPQSRPQPAADSPSRKLAVELLAADSRTNTMEPEPANRAQEYIAHAVTVAAAAAAKKTPSGPSQAPAAARGAAAAAAGPVAVPVVAAKAGSLQDRRGPSIG